MPDDVKPPDRNECRWTYVSSRVCQRGTMSCIVDHSTSAKEAIMANENEPLTRATMKKGGRYNFKNQPERLIYLGRNWSGNGFWHQFKKIGDPREVWAEVLDNELHMLEEIHD